MIKHTFRKNGDCALQTCNLTPIKAIRFQCIECMGFQVLEVAECTSKLCPLFPFRMGRAHTPGRAHKNNPEKTTQGVILGSKTNERQAGHS